MNNELPKPVVHTTGFPRWGKSLRASVLGEDRLHKEGWLRGWGCPDSVSEEPSPHLWEWGDRVGKCQVFLLRSSTSKAGQQAARPWSRKLWKPCDVVQWVLTRVWLEACEQKRDVIRVHWRKVRQAGVRAQSEREKEGVTKGSEEGGPATPVWRPVPVWGQEEGRQEGRQEGCSRTKQEGEM